MLCRTRRSLAPRVLPLILFSILAARPAYPAPSPAATPAAPPWSVASFPPEVRLRRLHLVRPDLIAFPIPIENLC